MTLNNKMAIVTGGGRDIGRAVSLKLAAEGAKVCINYANDSASAEETLRLIEAAGGTAIVHKADVTDATAVDGLVAATQAAFGGKLQRDRAADIAAAAGDDGHLVVQGHGRLVLWNGRD